jgi:hypothetical protein
MDRQKIRLSIVIVVLIVALAAVASDSSRRRDYLVYADSLDEEVVRVDDQPLTLRDMAFYVAYEEQLVEQEAKIYDPDDSSLYWKKRLGGQFIRIAAKQAALDMAVHDEILYRQAIEQELTLDENEQQELANSQYDFWSDLSEEQRAALGVSKEEMDEAVAKAALAQKEEWILAGMSGEEESAYEVDGDSYEELRETHRIETNDAVWDRIFFGEITTFH